MWEPPLEPPLDLTPEQLKTPLGAELLAIKQVKHGAHGGSAKHRIGMRQVPWLFCSTIG